MKFAVRAGLSLEELRRLLPRPFRPLLPDDLPGTTFALATFARGDRYVVLSRLVRKALDALAESAGEQLIAAAGSFTAEGLELLQTRRAIVLQLREPSFTDDSYREFCEKYRL